MSGPLFFMFFLLKKVANAPSVTFQIPLKTYKRCTEKGRFGRRVIVELRRDQFLKK